MTPRDLWQKYRDHLCVVEPVGFWLDISRMLFPEGFLESMEAPVSSAFDAMEALEGGAIANPDEGRMVGHYWLRAPELAPSPEIGRAIEQTVAAIERFASGVHASTIKPPTRTAFKSFVVIGIGGSALGPQYVADALGSSSDPLHPNFIDNTDPEGIDRLLARIGGDLAQTLVLVISKSGGTKETRNGMLEIRAAYDRAGLAFGPHAVAVTGEGSELDGYARAQGFIGRFPMWDWVGGRTSETSAVGLLPAALQGIRIRDLLGGARDMDAATRTRSLLRNPAALLASMWHHAGSGRGRKDMVVLPYCDRFLLFSRYLQQLVMESLGKERDFSGRIVNQGLAVYGNKGSTDQHAYVQQLREGIDNFFVTFIEVLEERRGAPIELEPGATSGDFLSGFLQGTRQALHDNGRGSMTLTVPDRSPRTVGALIALFERAVGLYASLIQVNAYNQPGVEAGKKAAEGVIAVQRRLLAALGTKDFRASTAEEIAAAIGAPDQAETVFKILYRLSSNAARGIVRIDGGTLFESRFSRTTS